MFGNLIIPQTAEIVAMALVLAGTAVCLSICARRKR